MILDQDLMLARDQAVTASAASENIAGIGENRGQGECLRLFAVVTSDFATLDSLSLGLQSADDEAFTSPVTHLTGEDVPAAQLKDGYEFNLPPLPPRHGKYLRLYFNVSGADATGGTVTAGVRL
jgi:hypothetical protein